MTFGEKLQRLRKTNGLSQEQLSEKLNVSRQAISKWELGTIPDMDNILKISRFFDCSLDYLMNNEIHDAEDKAAPVSVDVQRRDKGKNKFALRIYAGIAAGIGAIGLLVLGILASVCPAILYDPPQGEVRTIMETGFWAFLKVHNIMWLFALCCGFILLGAAGLWIGSRRQRES